ncbi:hypothetical protein VTO42DRAFT_8466 [Malbranchea cinnamomea]
MPSNAIAPSEEIRGHSVLPLSRIKKIIRLDEDIQQCSNSSTFLIAMATEMFIQYLVEQGHNVVKSERKPRKNIQYRDLATAVSRIDNLEFLSDVIPKTTTYRQFKEKRAKEAAHEPGISKSQRTLNRKGTLENGTHAKGDESLVEDGEQEATRTSSPRLPTVIHSSHEHSPMADEMNDSQQNGDDVEMVDS